MDKDLDKLIEEIKNNKFESAMKDEHFELILKVWKNVPNLFKKKEVSDK